MDSKEDLSKCKSADLSKCKSADLQKELESRGLETSGKKTELIDRLWAALQMERGKLTDEASLKPEVTGKGDPQVLLTKLRILKEREALAGQEIELRAQLEREQARIKARSEQLNIELELAEMGHVVDVNKEKIGTSVTPLKSCGASEALAAHVQRVLLPPTELTPFSGDVQSYNLFTRAFDSRIVSRVSDKSELLYYLAQFTRGKPHQIVKSCLPLGERGYDEARRLLDGRYGSAFRLVESYVDVLRTWPRVAPGDVEGLDRLSLFLLEIQNAMAGIQKGELEHPRTLREIIQKLPASLRDRWMREADKMMEQVREGAASVSFKDLVSFIQREVRILRNPVFGAMKCSDPVRSISKPAEGRGGSQRVNVVAVNGARPSCTFCQGSHHLDLCDKLRFRPYSERKAFIQERRLCFGCLKPGHQARSCQARLTCRVCGFRHASLLHRTGAQDPAKAVNSVSSPSGGTESPKVVSAGVGSQPESSARTYMPIVPVRLRSSTGREVVTNAFLDQGSSTSFIVEGLADQLGVERHPTTIRIDTVAKSEQEVESGYVEGVLIAPLAGTHYHDLPPLFTLPDIPVTSSDRCSPDQARRWDHLDGIEILDLNVPVGVMIGSNVADLLMVREVVSPSAGRKGPFGVRVDLGWYVVGLSCHSLDGRPHLVNFLRKADDRDDDVRVMFEKLYSGDFSDVSDNRDGMSVEDKEWLKKVKGTVRKDEDGHFEIALPRSDMDHLPDSFPVAERRLASLKRKFRRDPGIFQSYRSVIHSLGDDGYAEKVPPSELEPASRDVWYLPHHAVETPEKLRVVFDCAARSAGVCLNDILQGGPHLGQPLTAVISRFREGSVAFACDIQAMYHRVHVPASDSDLLRFLWFKDDDINSGEIEVWRMRSHVFGAVSSSSIASLAVQLCAEEGKQQYPEAADVLLRDTYVDDALVAVDSVQEAVSLADDLKQLCKTGAFSMRKFVANSAEFLRSIPTDERGKGVRNLNLDRDGLGSSRALGVEWCMEDDTFRFRFRDRKAPVTRRGILSTVSSIFDPIGFWAPISMSAKLILQKLCAASCGWDDAIPPALADAWQVWLREAEELSDTRLPRDISGPSGEACSTELHVFVDASESAYSAVAYIRKEMITVSGENSVFVRFLMGKSRVAPLRSVSIPRLELAGAVLGSQIRQFLVRELNTKFDKVLMWTDSMVVLRMIRNRTTRFKTYVANRLALIHDVTEVCEWGYVPSGENPADVGSRGADVTRLGVWLEGPGFLKKDRSVWPVEPSEPAHLPASEVKRSSPVATAVVKHQTDPFGVLVSHFSSFYRLKVAVTWYKRFMTVLKSGEFRRYVQAKRKGLRPRRCVQRALLTQSDLSDAEVDILRYAQSDLADFPHDRARDGPVRVARNSPLASLKPEVRDGLLVVGGRLNAAKELSMQARHPVILPREHHVSKLVIREAHRAVGHEGREHTLWRLREKYWVIGAGREIRKMLRVCTVCRKVSGRPLGQLMADLPEERVVPGAGAFEKISCDVFGPIPVKSGRKERKCWGLLCTCMTTRGVHIELLESLSTDSLINAIRRVAARRGEIRQVRSDNGTNMCGADRELREALSELDPEELQRAARPHGIDWVFNPPHGSHFSGSVERQIRSVRKIWRSMPVARVLDREALYTLLCEIESILNSRPLTYVTTNDGSIEPISPNHLLLLRAAVKAIPGVFDASESFSRRRWRYIQYLADQFWQKWKLEYLPTLQSRQKWRYDERNLKVGDIVLLVDVDSPRGTWPLARVDEVRASHDGRIRKAVVRTGGSRYIRPIHKMILVQSKTDLEW